MLSTRLRERLNAIAGMFRGPMPGSDEDLRLMAHQAAQASAEAHDGRYVSEDMLLRDRRRSSAAPR
jgi:hypothetical protein